MSNPTFSERLVAAIRKKKNAVCVGLDPRMQQLPAILRQQRATVGTTRAVLYRKFCFEVIDAVAHLVPIIKPQAAFFEQLGPQGMVSLFEVIKYAQEKGLLVLMDAKRGDIGSTAEAYASGYLASKGGGWGVDAITINPYLGDDTMAPFLDQCDQVGGATFVLVKTSNPGSGFLQDIQVDGRTISEIVADWVETQSAKRPKCEGYGPVGAVVGATYPEELLAMRKRMPSSWILIPGYGAQGGSASDVAGGFDDQGLGAIVNSSRGIIFAYETKKFGNLDSWQQAVEAATKEMIQALRENTTQGKL